MDHTRSERANLITMFEPEPVTVFQIVELDSDNASECRTDSTARQWVFRQTSREEIQVMDRSIE